MRHNNWATIFTVCALVGALIGYFLTLIYRPALIPPALRLGGLTQPVTVLLLGTDIVYSRARRGVKADPQSYQGRSDTVMVCRLDPIRNTVTALSIPRDTTVSIPGHGRQKVNAANALGGPRLVAETIYDFLGVPVDHYVVLNVHGLVELVDQLGGITVDVPKRMHYVDRSAKLNIDLEPGKHLLNGEQAMGFVRFRHDSLGDIGRVQRQEIFMQALQEKFSNPATWTKIPDLIKTAGNYTLTDLNSSQIFQMVTFARSVPKDHEQMIMLPGHFSGTGDWAVDDADIEAVAARLRGQPERRMARSEITVALENASSDPHAVKKLYSFLSERGYRVVASYSKPDVADLPLATTRIIAQKGNTQDALQLKRDLLNTGEVVNASVGDIASAITILAGDDLGKALEKPQTSSSGTVESPPDAGSTHRRRKHHRRH